MSKLPLKVNTAPLLKKEKGLGDEVYYNTQLAQGSYILKIKNSKNEMVTKKFTIN